MATTTPIQAEPISPIAARGSTRLEDRQLQFAGLGAIAAAVIGAVTGFIATSGTPAVSLVGDSSIRAATMPVAVIIAIIVAFIGYRSLATNAARLSALEQRALSARGAVVYWIGRVTFALMMGFLCYLVVSLTFDYLDVAFAGTTVFRFSAIALVAMGCAAVAFGAAYLVGGFTIRDIIPLTAVLVTLGMLTSMVTVENPQWWVESLSYMGDHPPSWDIFNPTMILTGLGVLVGALHIVGVMRLMTPQVVTQRAVPIFLVGFIVIGLGIAGVGFFPYSFRPGYNILHDVSSHAMAGAFIVLMVGMRWLTPGFPRTFHIASALMGITIVASAVIWIAGGMSFVLFELVVFGAAVPWLLILQRYVITAATDLSSASS
jgi:hypothetical protein